MTIELSWSVDHGAGGVRRLDGEPADPMASNAAGYGTMRSGICRGLDALGIPWTFHQAPTFLSALVPVDYRTQMPPGHEGHPHPGGNRWRRFCRSTDVRSEPKPDPVTRPGVTRICIGTPDSWTWDGAGRRIGMTMWESSALPSERNVWTPWLEAADEVLVPCEHNAALVRAACRVPVRVVPLGLNGDMWPLLDRPRRTGQPFVFLLSGQLSFRKGWMHAYFAFARAFGQDPRFALVYKTSSRSELMYTAPKDRTVWNHRFTDPNVRALRGHWSRRALLRLYGRADAFVWPTLGEGWGLPPREAAATGLPVITTQHTGQFDADLWAWRVVPTTDDGTPALFGAWGRCGTWQKISVDDLAAAMVQTVETIDEAREWARDVARPYVTGRTWVDVARDILAPAIQQREVLCA